MERKENVLKTNTVLTPLVNSRRERVKKGQQQRNLQILFTDPSPWGEEERPNVKCLLYKSVVVNNCSHTLEITFEDGSTEQTSNF